jgi:hypothetical protein
MFHLFFPCKSTSMDWYTVLIFLQTAAHFPRYSNVQLTSSTEEYFVSSRQKFTKAFLLFWVKLFNCIQFKFMLLQWVYVYAQSGTLWWGILLSAPSAIVVHSLETYSRSVQSVIVSTRWEDLGDRFGYIRRGRRAGLWALIEKILDEDPEWDCEPSLRRYRIREAPRVGLWALIVKILEECACEHSLRRYTLEECAELDCEHSLRR